MEQARPLSKRKSPVADLLSGDVGEKAARILGPRMLEMRLSNDDHHGSGPSMNPLNSLEKDLRKKSEAPKRNLSKILATLGYGCKYCKAKFSSLQSLGGHQNAHRVERAARKQARVMNRIGNAFSQVNLESNPNSFSMQGNPIQRNPVASGRCSRPPTANVAGPALGGTPKPTTIANPETSASRRPAMVNRLGITIHEPMNNGGPKCCAGVSPQNTKPRPPLANGSPFSTQGVENEGLDLTLRL